MLMTLLIIGLDLLVGTQNVFKLPPFKDGIIIHSLVSILSCVSPFVSTPCHETCLPLSQ